MFYGPQYLRVNPNRDSYHLLKAQLDRRLLAAGLSKSGQAWANPDKLAGDLRSQAA